MSFITQNFVALLALIVSFASFYISYQKNIRERDYISDKDLYDQLEKLLTSSYEAVCPGNKNSPPINDRLQWLTSARNIERYKQLKDHLQTELYITICEENENYWSDKFHKLLQNIPDHSYFKYIDPGEMTEESIDLRSACILHAFARWKHERPDPINDVSLEDIIIENKLYLPTNRHLWSHIILSKPKLAEEITNKIKS